ncbi:MAG: haloacid dehalogenase-like hydrolase [Bryobacteraceae bacterium]
MRRQGLPSPPAVILFDIDGTLIRRAGPHHRQALVDAVAKVTGLHAPLDHIPLQGMLDRAIVEWMMRDAGASKAAIARAMPAIVDTAQRLYVRRAPSSLRSKVCPGVRPLLTKLKRAGIPMGLVTGNLTRIGWLKMERAGIREHFQFGAFAEQARDRAGLVKIALRHARPLRPANAVSNTWLIGDHENDIAAARANGVRSVAVATGVSARHQLAACSPDLLLDDLRALSLDLLLV